MARMEKHTVELTQEELEDYGNRPVGWTIYPASAESVVTVLDSGAESINGRSNWVWLRLPNGGLILGVFPQGDTYMETEKDHPY